MNRKWFIIILIWQFYIGHTQTLIDTISIGNKLDSLLELNNSSLENYKNFHEILHDSKELSFKRGILDSYIEIIWYQGIEEQIDSLFYYSNLFEQYERNNPSNKKLERYLISNGDFFTYVYPMPEYALSNYLRAYELIDKTRNKDKNNILNNIANCYISKGKHDLAIKTHQKILSDSLNLSETEKTQIKASLVLSYQEKNNLELSESLIEDILKVSTKNKDNRTLGYAKLLQAKGYYLRKEYPRAIDSLQGMYDLLNEHFNGMLATNYEYLSLSYAALNDFEKAKEYLKEVANVSNPFQLPETYELLSSYYKELGKEDSSLYYLEKKSKLSDSLFAQEKKTYNDYYESKIDLINKTQQNEEYRLQKEILTINNSRQKNYIATLIIAILFVLAILSLFVYLYKYSKSQEKIQKLEESERQHLEHQIKVRENELSALLMGQSQKKKELINIKNLLDKSSKEDYTENTSKVKKALDRFFDKIESDYSLMDRLESQYPGVVEQLKKQCPELSKNDIRHCLLIKLKLSLKESANLLNVTPNTVKTARYRAKSKLSLEENRTLEEFLEEINNID